MDFFPNMFSHLVFPSPPPLTAQWQAVYLEPIIGSGERFTAIIIVNDMNNNRHVFNAIKDNVLDLLYADKSNQIKGLIDHIKSSIIRQEMQWKAPFSGIYFSDWYDASDYDIEGIVSQAIIQTASLGIINIEEEQLNQKTIQTSQTLHSQWVQQIKSRFIAEQPNLIDKFDIEIYLSKNIHYKYDFAIPKYAASIIEILNPQRFQSSIFKMQALSLYQKPDDMDCIIRMPSTSEYRLLNMKKKSMLDERLSMIENMLSTNDVHAYKTESYEEAADRMLMFVA